MLLDLLFPLRCLGCNQYDHWVCSDCIQKLTPVSGALGLYQDVILKRAIHLMKYQGYKDIAVELGQYLAATIPSDSYDLVVPVPLHWRRRWERGYNQAAILAQQFPKPWLPAIHKPRPTLRQATLNRQDRLDNLKAAFIVSAVYQPMVQGKRIVLIDDVYSTGATTAACTQQLLLAGAAEVRVVVVALNVKNAQT